MKHCKISKSLNRIRFFDGAKWHELNADAVNDERDGFYTLGEWPDSRFSVCPEWEEITLDAAIEFFNEWHGRSDLCGYDVISHHLNR